MAKSNLTIEFKLWDYWIDDPIDRGYKSPILYVIYEIKNTGKLELVWRELNDE